MERVLCRLRTVSHFGPQKKRLWKLSALLVSSAHHLGIAPSVFNQALIELEALVYTPRNPHCSDCAFQTLCRAFQAKNPEAYPEKKKRREWVEIKEAVEEAVDCFLNGKGEVLLKKKEGRWRKGKWVWLP